MSLRLQLLAAAEAARKLSGPTFCDIRTSQLTIRTRVWSGSYIKDGTPTDTDLVLPAHYPIRFISGEEVNASGGEYSLDDVLVNHITPSNGAGVGYTKEQLSPPKPDNRTEIIYVLTGALEGLYELKDARFHRPFTYQLVLSRRLDG